ncbi:MAG TPA: hypothetical protein VF708_04995 [Pyrinomonadaceae bacterium]|jgi:hypothetical protein
MKGRIKRKGRKGDDAKGAKKKLLCALCVCFFFAPFALKVFPSVRNQESYPAPPADRTLIYFADEANKLTALPFESGETPLRVDEVAKSDKRSYIEVKGESASTVINNAEPRFYLFVPDVKDVHTPFLVRLTNKGSGRRVTAMRQRGQRGFAINSEEIIMPHYRVLARDGGMLYMEFRARQPLPAGQYAFVGVDLQRIATFRIGTKSQE